MENTELALLPKKENAIEVFSTDKGLDPFLAHIRAEIDGFLPDVSTKKGRDAIASIAYKVAKSKTALDNMGKDLVAELKDVPKKIDAERKRMRDLLDAWKDEVRKPLTEWEQAEEARKEKHKDNIQWFSDILTTWSDSVSLQEAIDQVNLVVVDDSFEEFEAEAHRAKSAALENLNARLQERLKYEAEQAELESLRKESAEREQKEREERIAREAAERAQREAEERAHAEREAAIKRETDAKAEAERRELELKLQAERAEREKLEAQQREQAAKEQAERERKQAEENARIAAENARQAEIQRQQQEQESARLEQEQRESNKRHCGEVNRNAKNALMLFGLTDTQAMDVVKAIVAGKIPNVSIKY